MKKIAKKDIAGLLSKWQKDFTVFVPSQASGVAKMVAWDGKDTAFLDRYRNTVVPPKANFLLNMEKMFGFSKNGRGYEIKTPVRRSSEAAYLRHTPLRRPRHRHRRHGLQGRLRGQVLPQPARELRLSRPGLHQSL